MAKIPKFFTPNANERAVDPTTGKMEPWLVKMLNDFQNQLSMIEELNETVADLQNQIDNKCP